MSNWNVISDHLVEFNREFLSTRRDRWRVAAYIGLMALVWDAIVARAWW